jgi:hypothetical protein
MVLRPYTTCINEDELYEYDECQHSHNIQNKNVKFYCKTVLVKRTNYLKQTPYLTFIIKI